MSSTESGCTVRAVCGLVAVDGRGRVLLVRRRDDASWGLPGGGVEPGETWARAALRECMEETGWRVHIDGLLGVYSDPATQIHRYPDGRQIHNYGVVFTGRTLQRTTHPTDEVTDVAFFRLDQLPEQLFGPDRPVLHDAARTRTTPQLR